MKITLIILTLVLAFAVASCGSATVANNSLNKSNTTEASPTPNPRGSVPKDGMYSGTGLVTKLDSELGSVEIDHEEIKDLMPPMRMEFFVSDKKLLNGVNVGDKVDFVIRYKDPTETIVGIKKVQ